MRKSSLRFLSSAWARSMRREKTSGARVGSWAGITRKSERGTDARALRSAFRVPRSAFGPAPPSPRPQSKTPAASSSWPLPQVRPILSALSNPWKGSRRMSFEARIEPLDGKLPKVSYHWDPETDILSVACKGGGKASGLNGTVDLEGRDGSFVVIDVAGGCLRGVDVVTWPEDILTVEKNHQESVFHLRVGRTRPATVVRVADRLLVEVDKQSHLVGLWFLDVPPFPNVEATA